MPTSKPSAAMARSAEWAAPLPWMTTLWDPNTAACAAAIVLHESRTRSMIVLDTGGAHLGVARCCATYTRGGAAVCDRVVEDKRS